MHNRYNIENYIKNNPFQLKKRIENKMFSNDVLW